MRKGIRQTQVLDLTDIDARFWQKHKQEQDRFHADQKRAQKGKNTTQKRSIKTIFLVNSS